MKRIIFLNILITATLTSCIKDFVCIKGNGVTETEIRPVNTFTSIENSTPFDVIYHKADTTGLIVKAEVNILPHIITETYNNTLELRTSPTHACFDYTERPVIMVTSPGLSKVLLSGSGDIIADEMSGPALSIRLSGSGNITAGQLLSETKLNIALSGSGDIYAENVFCNEAEFDLSGAGNISVNGSGNLGLMRISGSGNIYSADFILNSLSAVISGSGNIFTTVEETLSAILSGSGNIYLKGNPQILETVSGSGRIIKYR
ncbi:MAG: DUF2807 domain-containing protein [Bacteroidales bacterium]|nr:DUF2807 domain-containing protein [Bacteroidales bacterium]